MLLQNSFCWGLIACHFTDIFELILSQPRAVLSEQYNADPWLKCPAFRIRKESVGKKQENKKTKPKEKLCSCWRKLGLVDFRKKRSSPPQPCRADFHLSQTSRFLPSQPHGCSGFLYPSPASSEGGHVLLIHLYTPPPHIHTPAHILNLLISSHSHIHGSLKYQNGF